ncbi:uncharacterized protein LOC144569484 [Carex rostrata]
MAKSLRSKRKKRLRTLRREIAEPFYEKKEEAKLAAQEAALAADKLPVRLPPQSSMDVEMGDGGSLSNRLFKPEGGIGKKKIKKLIKLKKDLRLVKRGKLKSKNGQKF